MNKSSGNRGELAEPFPVIQRHTWLNHAAISPWPKSVSQAMQTYVADNCHHGPLAYGRWMEREASLRERAAALLGRRDSDEIALVANTSTGLNLVARGLSWEAGDSVVFPANDFPTNRLPWQALTQIGVQPRAVELDSRDPEASLIAAMGPRTRLLAVASVQYDTGYRFDLERLGAACDRHGVLLCIDAIQHLGALTLDVDAVGADFVVSGSHKWLLAPEGLALFWSRPEARELLAVSTPGWRMFEDPFNFDRTDWNPVCSSRRFEPGTLNTAAIHGLVASIGLLLEHGIESVERAVLARAEWLGEALGELPGVKLSALSKPEHRSGIVSFSCTDRPPDSVLARLALNNIHAAARGSFVRLSPHFYTPFDQLEHTIEVLRDLIRSD